MDLLREYYKIRQQLSGEGWGELKKNKCGGLTTYGIQEMGRKEMGGGGE